MDDLFSKKDSKPTDDILKYFSSGEFLEDSKLDKEIEEAFKYIRSTGGFKALPDEIKIQLRSILEVLPEDEQIILRLYLGIPSEESCTLEEMAKKFNLSTERVERIKEKAIKGLKKQFRKNLN